MKIYVMGKLWNPATSKKRSQRGFIQYAMMLLIVAVVTTAVVIGFNLWEKYDSARTISVTADATKMAEQIFTSKVGALKKELLHDLSIGCEVKGAKEPDGIIVFDSNNAASLGRFQFQITTVQHYYKSLYQMDISRKEAILIALDERKSTDLAEDILFTGTEGSRNWINCGNKINLRERVKMIKQLI